MLLAKVTVGFDPATLQRILDALHSQITDWPTIATAGGTFALAVVTLVLALKTGALARSGEATAKSGKATAEAAASELALIEQQLELLRQQADAARLQSEVAEKALNASVRPLLLDVPLYTMRKLPLTMSEMLAQRNVPAHEREADKEIDASAIWWGVHDGAGRMTIPVRNVGSGVARLTAAVLTYAREDAIGVPLVSGDPPSVIAPGELDWIRFEWGERDQQRPLEVVLDAEEELVIEVACSDLSGRKEPRHACTWSRVEGPTEHTALAT